MGLGMGGGGTCTGGWGGNGPETERGHVYREEALGLRLRGGHVYWGEGGGTGP